MKESSATEPQMTKPQFTVSMNLGGRSRTVNVEAEDALIAALKVKDDGGHHQLPAISATLTSS
jgi:hypothetical protein